MAGAAAAREVWRNSSFVDMVKRDERYRVTQLGDRGSAGGTLIQPYQWRGSAAKGAQMWHGVTPYILYNLSLAVDGMINSILHDKTGWRRRAAA
jgi:hypothetical protein